MQRDTNYELSADLLKEKDPFLEKNQWLKDQFNRLPFRIYNYWIGLTIIILLPIVCYLAVELYLMATDPLTTLELWLFFQDYFLMFLSSAFLLLGCGQVLYGVKKFKATTTQKGFLSYQYSLITATVVHLYTLNRGSDELIILPFFDTSLEWVIFALATILPITHIIPGFFVIRIFKKNHPLERKKMTSDGMNQTSKEIFEQNEVIAEEVWKYDKQLNRWPYMIYKWWLMIAITYEMVRLEYNSTILFLTIVMTDPDDGLDWSSVRFEVELLLMIILSAFAALKMESAMKTKSWKDSKISIIVLIICIAEALAVCIFTDKDDAFVMVDLNYEKDGRSELVLYLMWIAYCLVIPIMSLFGAYKSSQILKERDHYMKASNFADEDTYLSK